MKIINENDGVHIRTIDVDITNKFNWDWLNFKVSCVTRGGDKITLTLRDHSLRKTDLAGVAYCEMCKRKVTYSGSGKQSFNFFGMLHNYYFVIHIENVFC